MSGPGSEKKISRRALLKAAPMLAAAPYVLASSALGQKSGSTPPSDRVAIGIIGCGRSGANWIGGYHRLRQFQIVSVCDVDESRREHIRSRIEKRENGAKSVRDFREVLADDRIDAVVIATPDHWHAVIACAAARANKDIYCESPISLTVREARQMARVSRRYGRIFQAGLGHRYYASYRRACDLIRGGVLGKIRAIHVPLSGPSQYCLLGASSTSCPQGFDWDFWLGPAPLAPYHPNRCSSGYDGWRLYRQYSGGSMAYYGAGSLDVVQWFLGADSTGPVEFVPPRQQGEKAVPLTIRYADGTTVLGARGQHEGAVEFVGENGSLAMGVGEKGFTTWPETLSAAAPTSTEAHACERAMAGICQRTEAADLAAASIAEAFATANVKAKCALMQSCGNLAGSKALETLAKGVADPNELVQEAALKALAHSPEPGAADQLLKVARTAQGKDQKALALAGYIRLAQYLSLPADKKIWAYIQIMDLAQDPAQRKLAVKCLGDIPSAGALALAVENLQRPGLAAEAEAAACRISGNIYAASPEEVLAAMKRVADTTASSETLKEARRIQDLAQQVIDKRAAKGGK